MNSLTCPLDRLEQNRGICVSLLVLALLYAGCRDPDPMPCSMSALFAVPERYEGRAVQLKGVLIIEFENVALYASENAARYGVASDALWLYDFEYGRDKPAGSEAMNHRWIFIEGRFTAKHRGHLDHFGGGLSEVSRFHLLPESLPIDDLGQQP